MPRPMSFSSAARARSWLRALAQRGTARGRWEVAKVWDTIFPLVEPAQGDDGYGVIQLNSNAPSHLLLTNAIGVVNLSQLSVRQRFSLHKIHTPRGSFSRKEAVEGLRRNGRDNSSLNSHKMLPARPGSGISASHWKAISPPRAEIKKTKSRPRIMSTCTDSW